MVVAGAIGYYAASMLLEKSLRVFRGSWRGMALVAVVCIAVCCALRFDVLGVTERVPEVSQVASVDLTVAGNSYTFYPGQDDDLIEQLRTVHKAIVADEDYIRHEFSWSDDDARETYTYLRLTYNLSNGQTVYRTYSVPMTQARIDQEGTYDQLLDAFVNSQEMKARRLHEGDDRYTIDGGDLYVYYGTHDGYDLNSQQAAAIAQAVARDRENGTWGTYDWFDQDADGRYALSLELDYRYQRTEDSMSYDWISIYVRPGMTNTVACLKDLGLVTDEDLVTYADLDQEDALSGEEVAGEVIATYPEDTSTFGVIGGADGPTETIMTAVG
jgi:ABC-2 type transport system permease protein